MTGEEAMSGIYSPSRMEMRYMRAGRLPEGTKTNISKGKDSNGGKEKSKTRDKG